jgi:orotidine-5'-phosphate decarboxylase
MRNIQFRKMLAERQKKVGSLVCVGLDPVEEKIPRCIVENGIDSTAGYCRTQMENTVIATAEYTSMFKPNLGCWINMRDGIPALQELVKFIHNNFPDIVVFLDSKSEDIARTQEHYGEACFDLIGADGMNFSPYMGRDCMAALVDKENLGRALVGLCYTSNPDAREIQDVILDAGPRLWEFIAQRTLRWAYELSVVDNAGLVMAAAYATPGCLGTIYSDHLIHCREMVGDKLWFLIPGIGTQGGFIAETVKAAYAGPGSIAINSSSEIIFASSGEDYAEAAAQKAKELRDKINASL